MKIDWSSIIIMKELSKLMFSLIIVCRCLSIQMRLTNILDEENFFKQLEPLTTSLFYKIKSDHCYVLCTDTMYQVILQRRLFQELNRSTYFLIKPNDYDDLLAPNDAINRTLYAARYNGCQTYLIYMANGIQVERLLRYIDLNRLVNPMAKFLILHDYRLFRQNLHFIWQRLINVLFVRQYDPADVVKKNGSNGEWIELSTVPFPLPIKQFYVDKLVDVWHNGKYRKKEKLFGDKTLNLKGESLKAVMLKHAPAVRALSNENTTEYSGLEVEILRSVAMAMNFTANLYETIDAETEKWGTVQANGTANGVLGEMMDGNAIFALANLYYTPVNLEKMDLTLPYTIQCLTFLTPESLTDNSWQTLILPFSWEMWTGVLIILILVGLIFYLLARIHVRLNNANYRMLNNNSTINISKDFTSNYLRAVHLRQRQFHTLNDSPKMYMPMIDKSSLIKMPLKLSKDIFDSFGDCIFYTYSMLLVVSLPRLPRGWSIRLLTGWYWVYCILVVVAYRASLTAILANPAPRLTIDTLTQLAKSSITCGSWGEQNKQFFFNAIDSASQKIGSKMEEINDADDATEQVAHGDYAYYENEHFLRELRSKRDSDSDQQTLHIMKECAIHMPIAIGMERNSPIKRRVNVLIRRLQEAGLITKWLSESIRSFESSIEGEPQEALMDLKKLYAAFVALGIGYLIAFVFLFGEIIYWKYFIVNNPQFDVYDMRQFYRQRKTKTIKD